MEIKNNPNGEVGVGIAAAPVAESYRAGEAIYASRFDTHDPAAAPTIIA